MAVENKSKSMFMDTNTMENSKNKVYINPNFNRLHVYNMNSNAMHVNPKFSHIVSNGQNNIQNKNKIYVNPNFIKSNNIFDNKQIISSVDTQVAVETLNSIVTRQEQPVAREIPALQIPITQSRYCLVRQNVNQKVLLFGPEEQAPEKVKTTFTVNKYKSVPWKDIKRNLDYVKNDTNDTVNFGSCTSKINTNVISNKKYQNMVPKSSKNKFRLINCNKVSLVNHARIKTKLSTGPHKKEDKYYQARLKKIKGNLKKNNIPCPLFRKFGKCLRNARGHCEFLHDKKHVSICRKFLKGFCHDTDCLLSHDLTTKKMPTCYFYLQGTCTKTDCPYLHVKLNEKAKTCPDFLKGYCEKGSKCLLRHINVRNEKKVKDTFPTPKSSYRNKYYGRKAKHAIVNNSCEDNGESRNKQINGNTSANIGIVNDDITSECRYYQEHRDDGSTHETCETIKPTRCKLGTLPSFIQL